MTSEPAPNAPPLPQLSGPPPVPRVMKRAHAALTLSVGAWLAFLVLVAVALVAVLGKQKQLPFGISASGLDAALTFAARSLVGISIAASLAGVIMGLVYRSVRIGKVAIIVGGILFVLWLIFFGAILVDINRR